MHPAFGQQLAQHLKARRLRAGLQVEAAHVVDDHRHRQRAEGVGDGGQGGGVGPQLGMQAGIGQRGRQRQQVGQAGTAGKVAARAAAVAEARRAHAACVQALQRGQVAGPGDDHAAPGRPFGQGVQQQ